MSRAPRWSLFFFASADADQPATATYDLVLRCAEFADRHGLHAIWIPERHFDPFGAPYPDPAVLAAAVAVTTQRIGIRAGSVVLPLHDPLLIAERWAVVDNLSRGRVGISLASGWHSQDFVLSPGTYESRKEVLTDRLDELRSLWSGNEVARVDGTGADVRVAALPRPVQPELPVWFTSASNPATWQAAARHRANVLTALLEQSVDELAAKNQVYRQARREAGLDPAGGEVTVMVHTLIGDSEAQVRELVRDPLMRYLRGHVDLFEKLVRSRGMNINLDNVTEADKQMLATVAFERYFTTNGLFGSPESTLDRVAALVAAGVTEIACLVDFGVDAQTVLAHLDHLRHLAELSAKEFGGNGPATREPAG